MKKRVGIIGGGASGLVAAIGAARNGAEVTVIEHMDRVGKKILSTGNGRCNLTNYKMEEDCYRCGRKDFPMQVIRKVNVNETLEFFMELGIVPKDRNGYIYPNSDQAASVLDVLREETIDSFGVGERLITAKSEPVFGGVYKLAALETDGKMIPKIKISENVEKITNPGFKKVYRIYDKDSDKALADVITLADETIPMVDGYEIFDPNAIWKRKKLSNYYVKDLRVQIFDQGNCVYESPGIEEIKDYTKAQIDTLWDETLRFENPQTYYVDLSQKLWDMKHELLSEFTIK